MTILFPDVAAPRAASPTRAWHRGPARLVLPVLAVFVAAALVLLIARARQPTIDASLQRAGPLAISATVSSPEGIVDRDALDRRVAETRVYERATALVSAIAVTATLLLLGGAVFVLAISGRPFDLLPRDGRSRRTLRVAALVGVSASMVAIPVRAGLVGGSSAMLEPAAWWFVLTTPVGSANAMRLAGVVLLNHSLRSRPERFGRPLVFVHGGVSFVGGLAIAPATVRRCSAALAASLVVSSFVVIGHAQASEPRWLLVICDLIHVIAGSVWLGGVVLLGLELVAHPSVAATAVSVDRFSKAAAAAVVTMFATGSVLAWGQLHTVDRLFSTSYGVTLLTKLVFVFVVVGLGAYNHQVLVPRVARGDDERAGHRLRRIISIEALVLVAGVVPMTVIMATGGLRNLA